QCGFKAFVREPVVPIMNRLRQRSYSFDAEFLFRAWMNGLSIEEVELTLIERRQKVRCAILLQSPRMFLDLLRIRLGVQASPGSVLSQAARFLLGLSSEFLPVPRTPSASS